MKKIIALMLVGALSVSSGFAGIGSDYTKLEGAVNQKRESYFSLQESDYVNASKSVAVPKNILQFKSTSEVQGMWYSPLTSVVYSIPKNFDIQRYYMNSDIESDLKLLGTYSGTETAGKTIKPTLSKDKKSITLKSTVKQRISEEYDETRDFTYTYTIKKKSATVLFITIDNGYEKITQEYTKVKDLAAAKTLALKTPQVSKSIKAIQEYAALKDQFRSAQNKLVASYPKNLAGVYTTANAKITIKADNTLDFEALNDAAMLGAVKNAAFKLTEAVTKYNIYNDEGALYLQGDYTLNTGTDMTGFTVKYYPEANDVKLIYSYNMENEGPLTETFTLVK